MYAHFLDIAGTKDWSVRGLCGDLGWCLRISGGMRCASKTCPNKISLVGRQIEGTTCEKKFVVSYTSLFNYLTRTFLLGTKAMTSARTRSLSKPQMCLVSRKTNAHLSVSRKTNAHLSIARDDACESLFETMGAYGSSSTSKKEDPKASMSTADQVDLALLVDGWRFNVKNIPSEMNSASVISKMKRVVMGGARTSVFRSSGTKDITIYLHHHCTILDLGLDSSGAFLPIVALPRPPRKNRTAVARSCRQEMGRPTKVGCSVPT